MAKDPPGSFRRGGKLFVPWQGPNTPDARKARDRQRNIDYDADIKAARAAAKASKAPKPPKVVRVGPTTSGLSRGYKEAEKRGLGITPGGGKNRK